MAPQSSPVPPITIAVLSLREIGDKLLDQKTLETQTVDRAREHPEDAMEQEEYDAPEGDAFEEIYKGEVSKSGQAILPSKRSRKVPTPSMKANDVTDEDDDFSDDNADEVSETPAEEQNS